MYKQKAKMKSKNKILKERKGITLIALVITIIVLLILAGVSIATLTGQGNILENANNARGKTNEAVEDERVKLAVSSARITGQGNLTTKILQDAIGEQFGEDKKEKLTENDDSSWTFQGDIKSYTIDNQGTVKAENTSQITAEEVNKHIGQVVSDYTEALDKVGDWRIFYASKEEMFLISSNTITSSDAFGGSGGIPINGSDYIKDDEEPLKIVINDECGAKYNETYNSKWYGYGMTDTNKRSQATAYLCDSANWTEYVGENATYAVGGPTKELLVRSWVASGQTEEDLQAILDDTEVSDAGYTYNKPNVLYSSNPIKNTILPKTEGGEDGLYNNGSSYWLSSPSNSKWKDDVCYVGSLGCVSGEAYRDWDNGARPLVSIPMSEVQVKDGIVTIGSN